MEKEELEKRKKAKQAQKSKKKKVRASRKKERISVLKQKFKLWSKSLDLIDEWIREYTSSLFQTVFRYITAFAILICIFLIIYNYNNWQIVLSLCLAILVFGYINDSSASLTKQLLESAKKVFGSLDTNRRK